jgi:hypothetical protein
MSASPDLDPTPVPTAPAACSVAASCHLSADQVDDHLIGCLAAEPAAHLATCPLCTRRVAAAAAPFTSFQRVTTAWSERRSATLTTPIHFRQRPFWQRHIGWATACLTVAVGIALTTTSHGWLVFGPSNAQPATLQTTQQDAAQQTSAQQTSSPQDPATNPHVDQVSADNQMLQDIDNALDTSAETPSAFGLQAPNDQPAAPPNSLQD